MSHETGGNMKIEITFSSKRNTSVVEKMSKFLNGPYHVIVLYNVHTYTSYGPYHVIACYITYTHTSYGPYHVITCYITYTHTSYGPCHVITCYIT